jgi:group I intron endonuclease
MPCLRAKLRSVGIVYCVRNLVSGRVYVGQTTKPLSVRWTQHVSDAKHHTGCKVIARAIRKYGRAGFDVFPLAQCQTIADLNNLERVWIIMLRSMNWRYGYNRTMGGPGCAAECTVREKISSAAKQQWADPARRAKAVAGMKRAAAERLARWTPEQRREKCARDVRGEKNPSFGKPGTRRGAKWSGPQRARHAEAVARGRAEGRAMGGQAWTEDRRTAMSARFSGPGNPFFGKHHSEESRRKASRTKRATAK